METVGAISVFLFALLTAVATGLGAVPFAFAKHPTRRWLGVSNAIAAGLMLAASFGLIYEGMDYGPLRALAGVLRGLAFIVVARRSLWQDEHPAVFASMSGLDARKALLIVGVSARSRSSAIRQTIPIPPPEGIGANHTYSAEMLRRRLDSAYSSGREPEGSCKRS